MGLLLFVVAVITVLGIAAMAEDKYYIEADPEDITIIIGRPSKK